jgi:RND family efflux transporter MFP subunit
MRITKAVVRRTLLSVPVSTLLGAPLAQTAHAAAEFDCVIEPRQIVELRPSIEGVIEKIDVDRGDLIQKGQVLVMLESGVETAAMELAKYRAAMQGTVKAQEAKLQYSELRNERREMLAAEKYLSAQELDDARAEKRVAEAELIEARDNKRVAELEFDRVNEQLKLRTIRSPFAGVVMDRLMNPGDVSDMSDSRKPVLKIAEIGVLRIETVLPAAAYSQVKVGSMVEVMPDVLAARASAKVMAVDRVMDAASGTFGVRLEMLNEGYKLPAGMKCRALFPDVPANLSRSARAPSATLSPAAGVLPLPGGAAVGR